MSELLFEWSFLGTKTSVHTDRITYKVFLGGDKSIPIDKVASVELSGAAGSKVFVITNAGEKIGFSLMPKGKEAFKDAIYKAKELLLK